KQIDPEGGQEDVLNSRRDLWKDLRVLDDLREKDLVQKGCNSSFITLIPKVNDAKFIKDFRPISLIECQYKIVGKFLANRLSSVIGSLVSKEQSAFIRGRQILDGPM
ncbi:RNA-directed DNA polymerase, eukaryota, partial [Tanacetum coccineum]